METRKASKNLFVAKNYASIGNLERIRAKNLQRQNLLGQPDLFHPQTSNAKFERFVEDILDLDLPKEQTKKEITKYFGIIETFYNDKIEQNKSKTRDQIKSYEKKYRVGKLKVVDKHELEKIFLNAIDVTRLTIQRRKERLERKINLSKKTEDARSKSKSPRPA